MQARPLQPAPRQAIRLAATDLACRRGDRILFRGLGLSLGAGGALQLVGANGVGKSSLIRILAGLLRPFAGAVECDGAVALADERLALDAHLPLGAALEFWRRVDRSAPVEGDAFGLADLADVPVRFLSTGQKKRAAFARIASSGASVWLLDEPLNGLDAEWSGVAQAGIAAHCAGGGIAVIASHQPLDVPGLSRLALADFAP